MSNIPICQHGHECRDCKRAEATRRRAAELPHGTISRYSRVGCRCDACREAARAYQAATRANRMANPNALKHGSTTAYGSGCRCEKCCGAASTYMKKWRINHKKKEQESEQGGTE